MGFFRSMLSDGTDSNVSSKRLVTFLSFLLCALAFLANLFWKFEVAQFMYESMMYIVVAGLGFTASEKFFKETK